MVPSQVNNFIFKEPTNPSTGAWSCDREKNNETLVFPVQTSCTIQCNSSESNTSIQCTGAQGQSDWSPDLTRAFLRDVCNNEKEANLGCSRSYAETLLDATLICQNEHPEVSTLLTTLKVSIINSG